MKVTDWKRQIISAAVGMGVGILGTYALVWRDVAVIKAEISHIQADVAIIQRFISDDDPKSFIAAKEQIRSEHDRDKKE